MRRHFCRAAGALLLALILLAFGWGGGSGLGPGAQAPELQSGPWINSPPLRLAGLRGKVVFLEMWTFG